MTNTHVEIPRLSPFAVSGNLTFSIVKGDRQRRTLSAGSFMESSPLVVAQAHARKAAKADTPTAAVDEHGLAAGQFAQAAKDTLNSEAFRTLKLLEQHHQKLAKIIKFRSSQSSTQPPSSSEGAHNVKSHDGQKTSSTTSPSPKAAQHPEAQAGQAVPRGTRDLGSSIANELATARGIPANRQRRNIKASNPAVTQHHVEGKIVNPSRRSRLVEASAGAQNAAIASEKSGLSKYEDSNAASQAAKDPKEVSSSSATTKSDESFNRFYSTMENIFSRISAPLAFAGLPLASDSDSTPKASDSSPSTLLPPVRSKQNKTRATASPEYSRYFSPAAIRALREDVGTTGLNTAESFYVVPTTGGTMPYASILARHTQRPSAVNEQLSGDAELSDEFVDARETPGSSPRTHRKTQGALKASSGKTLEELELENTGLRFTCDELSRRLWKFEVSSQVTQQALNQSLRIGNKGSPAASEVAGSVDAESEGRFKALEKEMNSMKKENEKLRGVISKYRERFEKLKEGARIRREGTGGFDKADSAKGE